MIDIELRGGADSHDALATMLRRIADDLLAGRGGASVDTRKEGPDERDPQDTYTFDYDLSEYNDDDELDEEFPGFTGTEGHAHLHNGDEVTAFGESYEVQSNDPAAATVFARNPATGAFETIPWSALS